MLTSTLNHSSNATPPSLPVEIWQIIIEYHKPFRKDYAVRLPWKRSARDLALVSLTQVCSMTRKIALPLVWAIVYVETMKDWGLLWKRISPESGQYIQTFINFWAIAKIPHLCRDFLQEQGRDLLWYAFIDRKNNPLCDRKFSKGTRFINYKPYPMISDYRIYDELESGPDGHGPDAIIDSRESFIQACNDVSSTWSNRLETLYWDASTTFPEQVILNIRRIQESTDYQNGNGCYYPGLRNLCIDYSERASEDYMPSLHLPDGMTSDFEHARRMTYFNEPIWKLGPTTLRKLKFLSLAPPFWANVALPVHNPAHSSRNRLRWGRDRSCHPTGKLEKQLSDYAEDTGPGQYNKVLQSIQPEIFFSSKQSPFHCRDLLPRWARLRRIHIFGMVMMTNDNSLKQEDYPKWSEFFQTNKIPDNEPNFVFHNRQEHLQNDSGPYLRGAIQLRLLLERLQSQKGIGATLTGDDIHSYAISSSSKETLQWTEDWKYSRHFGNYSDTQEGLVEVKEIEDFSPIYKEWLQDPYLADQVARAFNEGTQNHNTTSYPFCHSEYPGKLYFETSLCENQDDKIWLDRPKHRGHYSFINAESFPKLRHYWPRTETNTLHRLLKYFPSYRPSM